ncbi:MAG: adenylate/guanylate cyclase domain-containing protein [Labilibaculum sp.]|nr:adenylate/guanylate cyclase domain-containing protein [Labilibaculum sp.]
MVAYFILGFLQFDRSVFSKEFIALNGIYSFWSGLFIGLIWGSFFKITILFRDRFTSYLGIVLLIAFANVLSAFLMVYSLFLLEKTVKLVEMPQTLSQLYQFYQSQMFYALLLYCFIVSLFFQFLYEMDRKLGRGVLINFILGRYHRPKEEQRVFLFMDLKSSTYYAEKLGHLKYSCLIQDCFHHLSSAVVKSDAQIYQFVGDEVVLSWEVKKGFETHTCLQCFIDFTNTLETKKEYYLKQYSMFPIFKAGLHTGKIMVAQVGQSKSEIAYHGDVINTASRVQGLCNIYNSRLLLTGDFLMLPNSEQKTGWNYEGLGNIVIKGKKNRVELFSFKYTVN